MDYLRPLLFLGMVMVLGTIHAHFYGLDGDFYLGMFKKNDYLVADDRLYKPRIPYRFNFAKFGRKFKCPITYIRVINMLKIRPGPTTQIIRGGLRKRFIVLKIKSMYNQAISVRVLVGCENKTPNINRKRKTTVAPATAAKVLQILGNISTTKQEKTASVSDTPSNNGSNMSNNVSFTPADDESTTQADDNESTPTPSPSPPTTSPSPPTTSTSPPTTSTSPQTTTTATPTTTTATPTTTPIQATTEFLYNFVEEASVRDWIKSEATFVIASDGDKRAVFTSTGTGPSYVYVNLDPGSDLSKYKSFKVKCKLAKGDKQFKIQLRETVDDKGDLYEASLIAPGPNEVARFVEVLFSDFKDKTGKNPDPSKIKQFGFRIDEPALSGSVLDVYQVNKIKKD